MLGGFNDLFCSKLCRHKIRMPSKLAVSCELPCPAFNFCFSLVPKPHDHNYDVTGRTTTGVGAKPGLWTLDWTVDWTLDCILDCILDRILDLTSYVRMAQKACQRSLYLFLSGCLWELKWGRRGVATLRSAGGGWGSILQDYFCWGKYRESGRSWQNRACAVDCYTVCCLV